MSNVEESAMKHRVAMIVAVTTLAGCAGTSEYARNERYAPTRVENDVNYIAAVEAEAHRRGVDVYWVHPPQKFVPPGSPAD